MILRSSVFSALLLVCGAAPTVLGAGVGPSRSHRRLEQWGLDADAAKRLSQYSIRYEGCHVRYVEEAVDMTVHDDHHSVVVEEALAEEVEDGNVRKRRRGAGHGRRLDQEEPMSEEGMDFVTLRLCFDYAQSGPVCHGQCRSEYDKAVVDLRTYLQYMVEYKWEEQDMRCSKCYDCAETEGADPTGGRPETGGGSDGGEGGGESPFVARQRPENGGMTDDGCGSVDTSTCLNECNLIDNMEENGYVDASEFIDCERLEYEDDSGNVYYIGPYCDADGGGNGIKMGIFTDEFCTARDAARDPEDYLTDEAGWAMKLSYHLLKQTFDTEDCVAPCAEDGGGPGRRLQDGAKEIDIFALEEDADEEHEMELEAAENFNGEDSSAPRITSVCEGLYYASSGFEAFEDEHADHDGGHHDHEEEWWTPCVKIENGTYFAGLSCEYEATSMCRPGADGEMHFCTNEGKCEMIGGIAVECSCPTSFYGKHCELRVDHEHEDGHYVSDDDIQEEEGYTDDVGWIAEEVPLWDSFVEVGALQALFRMAGGPRWKNSDLWLSDDSVCLWHGVGCGAGGWVTSLDLGENSMSGPFEAIGDVLFGTLPNLTRIDLGGNDLFGTIPHRIHLRELTYLNLSNNYLKGTISTSLSHLTKLESLLLQNNELSYMWIPDNGYSGLKILDLSGNYLSGTIQYDVLKLPRLRNVTLGNNRLSGGLPYDLSALRDLTKLDLSSNMLSGAITERSLMDNPKLAYLNLSQNFLSGTIPQGLMMASFADAEPFPAPHVLDLSFNRLEGVVPDFEVGRLEIRVEGNRLDGIAPSACDRASWNYWTRVGELGCDIIACSINTSNAAGRWTPEDGPCEPCEFARYIGTVGCDEDKDNGSEIPQPPEIKCGCLNGGICIGTSNNYNYNNNGFNNDNSHASESHCECQPGYYGVQCEIQEHPPPTVSSYIQITSPEGLEKEGGYDHRGALFGSQSFFGMPQFVGNVRYADAGLCGNNDLGLSVGDPEDDAIGIDVDDLDDTVGDVYDLDDAVGPIVYESTQDFILMADRGSCTFVTKARYAQLVGARALIVADNTCQCSAGDSCPEEPGQSCEEKSPILADDGSGKDIFIPTFLLWKQDADPIKDVLRAGNDVVMAIEFIQVQPDVVDYEVWTSPTDASSREFMLGFKDMADALRGRARFTPRMYIFDGAEAGCVADDDDAAESPCLNMCTNNGRYCATDPDDNLDAGISGADVVLESLRWICIWEMVGPSDDSVGGQWWNYVTYFLERCSDPDLFVNEECSKRALRIAGIEPEIINECIVDHGGVEGNSENKLLEEQLYLREKAGVNLLPSFRVNKQPIRGTLNSANALIAICAGFVAGAPSVCRENSSIRPSPPLYPTPPPSSPYMMFRPSPPPASKGESGPVDSGGASGLYNEAGPGSCQDDGGKMYSYVQIQSTSLLDAETCAREECSRYQYIESHRGFEFSVTRRCTCLFDMGGLPSIPESGNGSIAYTSKEGEGYGDVAGTSGTPGATCYKRTQFFEGTAGSTNQTTAQEDVVTFATPSLNDTTVNFAEAVLLSSPEPSSEPSSVPSAEQTMTPTYEETMIDELNSGFFIGGFHWFPMLLAILAFWM